MLVNILKPQADFQALMRHLLTGDHRYPRPVDWVCSHNLPSEDPRLVAVMMCATAELSRRCVRPAYAFTIGWHADEHPTTEAMKAVALATLDRIGLGEHQAFLICPADRVHPCVRLLVNRVHLDTGRAWATSHDYRRFDAIMKDLAAAHGFRHVPLRSSVPIII